MTKRQVERGHGSLKGASAKLAHSDSHDELRAYLAHVVAAYN